MTYKQTNRLSNLYLCVIIFSGIAYTVFLGVVINKILPGFIMQLIFLIDSIKFNNNLIQLVFTRMFMLNVTSGLVLIGLSYLYLKALLSIAMSIVLTQRLINSYNVVKVTNKYRAFRSTVGQIFTAGLLKPNIYISTKLLKSHSPIEIEAMVYHEENHRNNHHPLKTLIVNFIQAFLPPIPGKNWLVSNYQTSTEVSSDKFAETKLNSKLPIVSALLKYDKPKLNSHLVAISNFFNSQSERIKILVGQKEQTIKAPLIYALIISGFMFLSFGYFKNTTLFYNCDHLIDCIRILINPDSKPLLSSLNTTNSVFTINAVTPVASSDHCQ